MAGERIRCRPPVLRSIQMQRCCARAIAFIAFFLRFLIYIYNATRAAADSQPDVALQVQILRDHSQ